jgi:LysM repeat protein
MKALRYLSALMIPVLMASCKNTKDSGYEDPYAANFATDGGYNPYPSGGGGYETPKPAVSEPAYTAPSTPSYEAPPSSDNYAFESSSKPSPSTTSTSSKPKPKPTSSSSSSSTAKKKPTTVAKKTTSSKSHTVTKGDTLYGLALKNKTTVAKIKAANGLTSDTIRLGQKIKIP